MKILPQTAVAISVALLTACNSDDTEKSTDAQVEATVLTGKLIDAPVINIDYSTPTKNGVTDSEGRFKYIDGEMITFSIGNLTFPPVMGAEIITPLDITGETSINNESVGNIIRLLQTLDVDGNPENGIEISDSAKAAASNMSESDIDFTSAGEEFSSNTSVITLIEQGGQDTPKTELVTAEYAIQHFESQLASLAIPYDKMDIGNFIGTWMQVMDYSTFSRTQSVIPLSTMGLVSFFRDGTYAHIEFKWISDTDPTLNGLEYGKYNVSEQNANQYTFEHVETIFDQNGSQGMAGIVIEERLYRPPVVPPAVPDPDNAYMEMTMHLTPIGLSQGDLEFRHTWYSTVDNSELVDDKMFLSGFNKPDYSDELFGLWKAIDSDEQWKLHMLVFFNRAGAGTQYIHAEVDNPSYTLDDNEDEDGAEWGNYTLSESGELIISYNYPEDYDKNGTAGLSNYVTGSGNQVFATVEGDTLTMTFNENGETRTIKFKREPMWK